MLGLSRLLRWRSFKSTTVVSRDDDDTGEAPLDVPSDLLLSNAIQASLDSTVHYARPKGDNQRLLVAKVCYNMLHPRYEGDPRTQQRNEPLSLYQGVYDCWKRENKIFSECSASCEFIAKFVSCHRRGVIGISLAECYTFGSPLRDLARKTPIRGDALFAIAYCVLKGLEHIHRLGYFHGDIKPGNLLLSDQGIVKIADFGTAENAKGYGVTLPLYSFGTHTKGYNAPEVLINERHTYGVDEILWGNIRVGSEEFATMVKKRDIYALAVTVEKLYGGTTIVPETSLPPSVAQLVQVCKAEDVVVRATAQEALRHHKIRSMGLGKRYTDVLKAFVGKFSRELEEKEHNIRVMEFSGDLWEGIFARSSDVK